MMIVNTYSLSSLKKQEEKLDAASEAKTSNLKQHALKFASQKCGT